jgi:hypothetical protein
VTKLKERISVSKRERQKFDIERFDLKYLEDLEVKEKYQIEISNRFVGLESLDVSFYINVLGKVLEKLSRPQPKIN